MFTRKNLSYAPIPLPDWWEMTGQQSKKAAAAFYDVMRKRHTVRDFSNQPVARTVIEDCVKTAGTAPSGANHQPWAFVAIAEPDLKRQIRKAAEKEERLFYDGGAGEEWLKALEPIGTNDDKPHLEQAPWLIVVFAQRWGKFDDGTRFKNYYVPESVGIATGFLIAALHHAGLVALTHTPNRMKFLAPALDRPAGEKPVMILAVGHPAKDAMVPAVAKVKKGLGEILTVVE